MTITNTPASSWKKGFYKDEKGVVHEISMNEVDLRDAMARFPNQYRDTPFEDKPEPPKQPKA
jgi:hypothetical protein